MTDLFAWALATILAVAGLAGTVLPALPGPILILAAVAVAGWADDFTRIGWPTLVIVTLMIVGAHMVDLASSALGVRRAGASGRAVIGASLGALCGIFFGLPGLILGPFVGAAIGEFSVRRNVNQAGRVGLAAWIGFVVGTAAKVAMMIAALAVAVFAYLV